MAMDFVRWIGTSAIGVALLIACSSSPQGARPPSAATVTATPTPTATSTERPIELRLAALQDPSVVSYEHPLVSRFQAGVQGMLRRCDLEPIDVGDVVVNTRGVLERRGVRMSLLEILATWNSSIPETPRLSKTNCVEALTVFVFLRTGGRTPAP